MATPSVSSNRSKKRRVDSSWEAIFNDLEINGDIKPDVIHTFSTSFTPAEFLQASDRLKAIICTGAGIEGWAEKITGAIRSSQQGLPTPSTMKWLDVPRILTPQEVPPYTDVTASELFECTEAELKSFKILFNDADKAVGKHSEADASCRVFVVLLCLFQSSQTPLSIACQPTLRTHPDYLITVNNGNKKYVIIEVKKFDTTCDITLPYDATAQILREAHIMLTNRDVDISELVFILTNSIDWSFGTAKKVGDKIRVESTHHYNLHVNDQQLFQVYKLLKKILT